MNLTPAQEKRLRAGDYSPLYFPIKEYATEPVEPGYTLVLDWEDGYRIADQLGNVTVVPAIPVRWVVVTAVKRHVKAQDWKVLLSSTDNRQDPHWMARGGGYTTSRFRAIDELEVVDAKFQEQLSRKAYDRDRVMRMERVAADRIERHRFRRERQRAAAALRPAA